MKEALCVHCGRWWSVVHFCKAKAAAEDRAELDRLRAANKRLEAALAEIEDAVDYVDHEMRCNTQDGTRGDPTNFVCTCGVQRIRAAIEAAKVTP